MSPTIIIQDPRTLAHHPQRPWRPVESQPRRMNQTVIRAFAAPVVRELPPRRVRTADGTW